MKKSGFTLIEVLIALALSGILLLGVSDFFLASNKNIGRQMLEKGVDDRAFLALQMLGKDISQSAHILDAGTVGYSSATNIKAWLNLSPWVSGADLQVWHLNPNSDWIVLNSPKPIGTNYKKFALEPSSKALQIRLDGDMASGVQGNSLECLFSDASSKNWLGVDFADKIRIAEPNYYSFANPIDPSKFDSMQKQDFEEFLFKQFALHFGVWKNKNNVRVFPNNWHETEHLLLDKNTSILPKNQGCLEIENPPPRLIHIDGSKNSNPKGEADISGKISKNTNGAYVFNDAGSSQIVKQDFYAKTTQPKNVYFSQNKTQVLVVEDEKSWRRINTNGALMPKNPNLDASFTKISTKILGSVEVKNSGATKVESVLELEEFQPLMQVYNSGDPNKFFMFYANSNLAKTYLQQIAACPTSGWQMPQIVNYANCSIANQGLDFFNKHCKNWSFATQKLPKNTPIFQAKIPAMNFSCSSGFSPILNASAIAFFTEKQSKLKHYLIKTNTSVNSKTGAKSVFYFRSNDENDLNALLFKRVNANLGDLNYFATNNKIDKNSSLQGCSIKKIMNADFSSSSSSSTKTHYLPKFEAEVLLQPQDFIKTSSAKFAYKDFFNCRGDRTNQTSYVSSAFNSGRTNSEWRFSLKPKSDGLISNLKFEPHLWYVQKPTIIDKDSSRTLIYSIAKCDYKRHCSFENKNIRNQINGLNNMQIRFLNPLTGAWQKHQQMQNWLDANNQKWDKIKAVKIGLLVCDYKNFLPKGQTKTYKILDAQVQDNSNYCKVVSSSFYLKNTGLNMR